MVKQTHLLWNAASSLGSRMFSSGSQLLCLETSEQMSGLAEERLKLYFRFPVTLATETSPAADFHTTIYLVFSINVQHDGINIELHLLILFNIINKNKKIKIKTANLLHRRSDLNALSIRNHRFANMRTVQQAPSPGYTGDGC